MTGDALFGQTDALRALHLVGLLCRFIVKNASRKYPMGFLNRWANSGDVARGDFKCLLSDYYVNGSSRPMMAVAWKDQVATKYIVANCGTTLPGDPHIRDRRRLVQDEAGVLGTEIYQIVPKLSPN